MVDASLLRFHQISNNFSRPNSRDVNMIAEILEDANLQDYLLGADRRIWRDEALRQDLISAHSIHEFDLLTRWLIKVFLHPYHRFFGRRKVKRQNNAADADADLHH